MPEEATETAATVAASEAAAAQGDAGRASEQTPFLGTYKTREEAERGFAEKEDTIRRLQSERDKAQNAKDVIAQIAAALKVEAPNTMPNVEAQREALAKQFEEGGGRAVVDALANIQADMDRVAEEKATAKSKAVLEELAAIKERLLEVSPAYRHVDGAKVAEIQSKYGVTKEQAYKILADTTPRIQSPVGPARVGNSSGSQIAEVAEEKMGEDIVGALGALTGKPLTDAEKQYLNRKHAGKRK